MKKLLLALLISYSLTSYSQGFNGNQMEIIKTINIAYAEGLQNEGDSSKIDAGFHPDFYLLGKGDEKALRKLAIADWRARQLKNKAIGKLPRKSENKVSLKYSFIDITGDVAVARVDYYEGVKKTYIDYISLYRYESGWRIISKIYQKMD